MKRIRSLLLAFATAAVTFSCGDEGFGFDVASELPVEAGEMVIPIPATGVPTDIDPEGITFDYQLSDVDGFADALQDLQSSGQVFLLGIAYEFSGVNDATDNFDEAVPIDDMRMIFNYVGGGSEEVIIPLSGSVLSNTPKTALNITGLTNAFSDELLNRQEVDVEFAFDMGTVTTPALTSAEVDFDITIYFDVALRVRDINN